VDVGGGVLNRRRGLHRRGLGQDSQRRPDCGVQRGTDGLDRGTGLTCSAVAERVAF
jgi:hypothetical protein